MARGNIYHITKEPQSSDCMCEDDFSYVPYTLGVDYVSDMCPECAAERVAGLAKRFQTAGFTVKKCDPINNDCYDSGFAKGCYSIETGSADELEQSRMNYFRHRFSKLQKMMAETSLKDFANDTLIPGSLRSLISDNYSDAVYCGDDFCGGTYSMDKFIRTMKADTTYYIMPEAVIMH